MPGQAAAQLLCHPVHPWVPTPTPSRSALQLLLPRAGPTTSSLPTCCAPRQTQVALFCCSVSSSAALIQPAKKHQGFSKKQQNKDLFCCKTVLLHPPAPTHHPRTLLPSWGFPGVCPEHRAGPLPVGHPPTRCTSHRCPPFTASPWSKRARYEPVVPLEGCSQPLQLQSLLHGAAGQWEDLVPSSTKHRGVCPHQPPHGLGSSSSTSQGHKPKRSRGRGGMKRTGGHGLRNVHGWSLSGRRVLGGIPFRGGNSPASSVGSRLNLDVLVWEGGVGRRHQPTHSCFG